MQEELRMKKILQDQQKDSSAFNLCDNPPKLKWMWTFVIVVLFVAMLSGCSVFCKVKPEYIVKHEFVVCNIPLNYFEKRAIPFREWDWSTKSETDLVAFITEHRDEINAGNDQLEKIEKTYNKCKESEVPTPPLN